MDKSEVNEDYYSSIYDLFKFEQVGVYRYNKINPDDFAKLIYILAFELLDPENVKIVLE
jgi:hypothetical protein